MAVWRRTCCPVDGSDPSRGALLDAVERDPRRIFGPDEVRAEIEACRARDTGAHSRGGLSRD
jgi:hypothetical protein